MKEKGRKLVLHHALHTYYELSHLHLSAKCMLAWRNELNNGVEVDL